MIFERLEKENDVLKKRGDSQTLSSTSIVGKKKKRKRKKGATVVIIGKE